MSGEGGRLSRGSGDPFPAHVMLHVQLASLAGPIRQLSVGSCRLVELKDWFADTGAATAPVALDSNCSWL